ncbi:MAG: hypothetical protein RSD26_11735 [Cellulosilyticaceae bacterium]
MGHLEVLLSEDVIARRLPSEDGGNSATWVNDLLAEYNPDVIRYI